MSVGCPRCLGRRPLTILWRVEQRRKITADYVGGLLPRRQLKFGRLYRCLRCRRSWYLDGRGCHMVPLSTEQLRDTLEWNRRTLTPNWRVREALLRIRGSRDEFGNVLVPCSARTRSGLYAHAVVRFQQWPPVNAKKCLFIDQVLLVEPAEDALPPAVRRAAARAEWTTIGSSDIWDPPITNVETVDGTRRYALVGNVNLFFQSGKYLGPALRLSRGRECPRTSYRGRTTFIHADWDEGLCRRLCH